MLYEPLFHFTSHLKQLRISNKMECSVIRWMWFMCIEPYKTRVGLGFRYMILVYKYLPDLLVNMYNYYLMVKSMSCCCVCGSWLFSDPVTFLSLKQYCTHWYVVLSNRAICNYGIRFSYSTVVAFGYNYLLRYTCV